MSKRMAEGERLPCGHVSHTPEDEVGFAGTHASTCGVVGDGFGEVGAPDVCIDCYSTRPEPHAASCPRRPAVEVEAEPPVVEGAADLQALAAQIEARREAERRLDEDLDAAFAALVDDGEAKG